MVHDMNTLQHLRFSIWLWIEARRLRRAMAEYERLRRAVGGI